MLLELLSRIMRSATSRPGAQRPANLRAAPSAVAAEEGDPAELIRVLERRIGANPKDLDTRVRLSRLLMSAGQWRKAERQLNLVLDSRTQLDASTGIAASLDRVECRFRLERADQARDELDEVAGQCRLADSELDTVKRMGQLYFLLGGHARAGLCFRQWVVRSPDSAEALFSLSAALHGQRCFREAAAVGMTALERQPQLPGLFSGLCTLFDDLSVNADIGEPVADVPEFIELFARGNDCLATGDMAGAEAWFSRSNAVRPGWPLTQQRLGGLAAVRGDLEEADRWFGLSAAVGLRPDTNIRLAKSFFDELPASPHARKYDAMLRESGVGDGAASAEAVIFVSGDCAYFRRFAAGLLASARASGNRDLLWHFHIINPDAWLDEEFQALRETNPGFVLCLSTEARAFSSADEARAHYSCIRFVLLPELLRAYAKPVLLLDFDLLINGSLSDVIASKRGADLALVRWDERAWRIWDQFWASAVLAFPTPRSAMFFQRVAGYVSAFLDGRTAVWYLDQIALFAAFGENSRVPQAAQVALMPTEWCALHHVAGVADIAPGVVFWSVTYNIKSNAGAIASKLYCRHLPRTRRLFGWTMPGADQVFQTYLAGADVFKGRRMWDLHLMQLCLSRMGRRRRALDVGAHVGFWSYWLADHFQAVEAFEPVEVHQQCFEANIDAANVRLHRCALGRERGRAAVQADPVNSGMAHVTREADGSIEMRAMDQFGFDDVDFVKLDAEGFELYVLQGGVQTLQASRPLILIEQDERWARRYGQPAEAGLDFLRGLGARVIAELPDGNYLLNWPAAAAVK